MLEKGLNFAYQRNEDLENLRFQIQTLTMSLDPKDTDTKSRLDELYVAYNNTVNPHVENERKDFVRDGTATFQELKGKFKDLKFTEAPVGADEKFNMQLGK